MKYDLKVRTFVKLESMQSLTQTSSAMLTIMPTLDKIGLFEEFLSLIVKWFCESYSIEIKNFNDHPRNDLSKLKVIKIHFFAVTTSDDAISKFDSFYAMPFGHVESDIYSNLDSLRYFSVSSSKLQIIDISQIKDIKISSLSSEIVENLKTKNPDMIKYSAFQLVELSHKWFSWKKTFKEANDGHLNSKKINPEIIKNEHKIYSLNL